MTREPASAQPKILVVDDRPENLHSMQRLLASLQAEVITADSGHQALSLLLRHDFALILLDVMMPDMDGFETASLIRGNSRSRHVPIIFVTAADQDTARADRGYDLGAVDYLFKPLQPHVLLSKVRVFLQQASQQQQLQRSLQEVRRLQEHNALLLHAVGEGIMSLDENGHIGFANPAAERLLGRESGRLNGLPLTGLLRLSEQQPAGEDWLSALLERHRLNAGTSSCDQHWFCHADGHLFPVEYTLSALHSTEGHFRGLVLVFQDITERKEREALELASKYKSAFLANISHELRTPLHSLLILARKLAANEEGNLTGDQLRAAGVIQREGQDLLRLINDILDLSRVEAGKLSLHWEPVVIHDMVNHLEQQFQPMAAEKGLDLCVTLAPDLPASLCSDRQRLQQILKNLLSNAVKFTHQGHIELTVVPADNCDDQAVAFTVSDTGIGIPGPLQAEIFESFRQLDGAINRHYEGSGLGLAICRELTRLLGGRITLLSQPGQGSHFSLFLPLQPSRPLATEAAPEADPAPRPAPVPPPSSTALLPRLAELARGKTLLLVDNDMRTSFMLSARLRQHGINVIKAENPATALARLTGETRVDLLILALTSPCQDAGRVLAALPDGSCPALLLTTPEQEPPSLPALSGLPCLSKPLDMERLLTTLAELLARQQHDKEAQR
ncbi:response regulator [Oceanimonas marisflavi]|uniref:response regulator n=1 Tax=Oceanimonas marisflavi TaxID=2059724 RepID=UPI000D3080AB|nr:response regulator [Oceanimonas marisflavi]